MRKPRLAGFKGKDHKGRKCFVVCRTHERVAALACIGLTAARGFKEYELKKLPPSIQATGYTDGSAFLLRGGKWVAATVTVNALVIEDTREPNEL